MVQQVGAVEVEVRANLDKYLEGLRKAQQGARTFSDQGQREMNTLEGATEGLADAFDKFVKSGALASTAVRGFGQAVGFVTTSIRGLLGPIGPLIGLTGLGGITYAAQQAESAFGSWQEAQVRFEGRLRATQGLLGATREEIVQVARAISRETLTPVETLQNAFFEMGREGRISAGNLEAATRILPDLALRLGGIAQAQQALSAALRDPSKAFIALREAGLQFTWQQQAALKGARDLSDVMSRQSEVLRIIEQQIGGEAAALGRGVSGGYQRLAQATGELFVNLGGVIANFVGFNTAARTTADILEAINRNWFPQTLSDRIGLLTGEIESLKQQLKELSEIQPPALPGGGAAFGMPGGELAGEHALGGQDAERARLQARLATSELTREVLELGRAYQNADAQAQAFSRFQGELDTRVAGATRSIHEQIWILRQARDPAGQMALQEAFRLGIPGADANHPQVRALRNLFKEMIELRRQVAAAGQPQIIDRENAQIERQIQLFRYNNEEMRVQNQLLQIEQRIRQARQSVSQDQLDKLGQGMRDLDQIKRLTSTLESAFSTVFNAMGSALADFAATGKLNFKELADSIVRDLVRIATQAFIIQPIMQAITGFINPAVAGAVSPGATTSAIKVVGNYATGGSFNVPGTGNSDKPMLLAGLTPGERVDITPKGAGGRGGGQGVTIVNNINSSKDFEVTQTERQGPDGQRIMEQTFNEVMRRLGRGEGDSTLGARYGVRPRTVQR